MRFSTPCSRIRSSLVETSSSASSFLGAGFAGDLVCATSVASGRARVEVTMEAVPVRKVRRGVFISAPSMMMVSANGTNTHKQYNSRGMISVNGIEKRGLAVERNLSPERCSHAGNQMEVMIVAGGVGLDARQKFFFKSRRLGLFAQQQLVRSVDVFNAPPNVIAVSKAQR